MYDQIFRAAKKLYNAEIESQPMTISCVVDVASSSFGVVLVSPANPHISLGNSFFMPGTALLPSRNCVQQIDSILPPAEPLPIKGGRTHHYLHNNGLLKHP